MRSIKKIAITLFFLAAIVLCCSDNAQAGIGIEDSSSQGWNAASTGTTSLYGSIPVNAGDVVVMSVADNKKNSIALVQGGWSGGTNGVLTDLETSGDTYPASYISFVEVEQGGTYDFWMETGDPNLTAVSALYVLRSDSSTPLFLADSAEWVDPDNADNGTSYTLDYTFSTNLTDGVLIEAISARVDLVTKPVAYTEDANGADKRLLVSYDGVTGNSWTSAYTLAGGEAGKQTSSGLGVVFAEGSSGGDEPPGGESDTIHEWTFDTEADGTSFGGLVDSGSVGGATFGSDASGTSVANDTFRVVASGDGTSAFRNAVVSAFTEGKYELTWTVVSGQVTTDGINVGLGFRESSSNTDLLLVRTHYQTSTGFIIQTRMNNANTTLVTLGGATIANLSYRAVVDLDSDTFDLFYDLGAGEQTAATGMALGAPSLTLDMIRFAASSKDYGSSDEFILDNIAMTIPGEPIADPVLSNPTNTVTDGTGDGLALIGETNVVQVVIANTGGGIATNALATLMPAANPEYFTITTNASPTDLGAAEQTTNTFTIIARSDAAPGTFTFDIGITADGGLSVSNSVEIEVISGISVSGQDAQNAFSILANTTNEVVTNAMMTISNNSFMPLVCTFSDDASWLQDVVPITVDPRSASNVALIADSSGLTFGSYQAALSVDYSQPGSMNDTDFTVLLDVGAKITFLGQGITNEVNNGHIPGVLEPTDVFDIVVTNFNEGGVAVSNVVNSLSADSAYFTIVPLTAASYPVLISGATTTTAYRVTIAEDTPDGAYVFAVTNTGIYAGDALVWPAAFTLNVVNRAIPSVSPGALVFSVAEGNAEQQQVVVSNAGNASLSFTITDDAVWENLLTTDTGATPSTLLSGGTALPLVGPSPAQAYYAGESDTIDIGFPFPFYGTTYSKLYIDSNGAIILSTSNLVSNTSWADSTTGDLPLGNRPLIAPFRHVNLQIPDANPVRYILKSNPTRLVIVHTGVLLSAFPTDGTNLQFQTELFADGRIKFSYYNINGSGLDQVAVGIQDGAGSALNVDLIPASGTAILINSTEDAWVYYAPTGGTVPPFGSMAVTFTADATSRAAGASSAFTSTVNWSSGGSDAVSIDASVVAAVPVLESPATVLFEGNAGAITTTMLGLANSGNAPLNFTITDDAALSTVYEGAVSSGDVWTDISGEQLEMLDPDENPYINADNEGFSALQPIGFEFPFYGGFYTSFSAGVNGGISLGETNRMWAVNDFTTAIDNVPQQFIAPYWGNLLLDGNASIRYQRMAGQLIVTWENMEQPGVTPGIDLTFQAVLHSSGHIEFRYQQINGYSWRFTPWGIRSGTARSTSGLLILPGDEIVTIDEYGYPKTNYVNAISDRFVSMTSANYPIITYSPAQGTIASGGTAEVELRGNASGMTPGGVNNVTNLATLNIAYEAGANNVDVTFIATNSVEAGPVSPLAAEDADGDGMGYDEELIAGTDPLNADSVFTLSTDAGRVISWPYAEGRSYTVWYTLDLNDDFVPLAGAVGLTAGTFTDTEHANEPVIFYKVSVD